MEDKSKKRIKTLNLHEWSEDDTILCFYYTKFGLKNLYFKTETELCKHIGTTLGSLVKQSMNFRQLMGFESKVLSDYSKLQREVYELFNGISYNEFFRIVKTIIGQDDLERIELLRKKNVRIGHLKML